MRGARLISILVALGATLLTGGVASAAGHVVRITSALDPATITIAPGDRITWRNDDDDRHRIRTTSGPRELDSGNLEPGQAFSMRLTAPGRYEYYDHRNDELTRYYGTVIVRDGAPSDPNEPGLDEPGTPGAESPLRATIAIRDRVFRPRNVTIAAGGSITWRNDDDREHTATASGDAFDTGVLSPGESARESLPNPGTFSFLCVIHPEMTGSVTVTGSSGGGPPPPTPAPEPTPTPDDPVANPETTANDAATATASPPPPTAPAPTTSPSNAASPPTDGGPADSAGGERVGAAAASRDIGAVLLGIAAGGGMLLIAGAGFAAVRAPRDPGGR